MRRVFAFSACAPVRWRGAVPEYRQRFSSPITAVPRKSFSELINSPGMPVLVDFYATWCGPCKTMAPILEQVAAQHGGKLRIIKIDVDRNAAVAQQYRVQSIPTLILFHRGQPVWRQAGVVAAAQIGEALRPFVS
ncbi:thioredoxin [Hymenobacter sp.]|uniref:thioredoxin n=1 Tax=Hymenobacter sp. TaxID=1898978 RepID=UPI00286A3E7D|nr:thioredoxin [Hymenobacter sp.]